MNTPEPTHCGHICQSPHTQHGGVHQVKMASAFKTTCVGPWKSIIAECTTANLHPTSVINNLCTGGNGGVQTYQHKQESTFWLNTMNTDVCSLLLPYNVELGQRQVLYGHHKPVQSVLKKCTYIHQLPPQWLGSAHYTPTHSGTYLPFGESLCTAPLGCCCWAVPAAVKGDFFAPLYITCSLRCQKKRVVT